MDRRVIELPKVHTLRKRIRDRFHDQKAAMVVSISAVFMVALLTNEWIVSRNQNPLIDPGSRGVASATNPEENRRNIQWEHELAAQLATDQKLSNFDLAEKPSLRDQLVFGTLQGLYGVRLKEGRIESLEFLDPGSESAAEAQPLQVGEGAQFLKKYRSVMMGSYSDARLQKSTPEQDIYQLLDSKNTMRGQALFYKDNQGRWLKIEIKHE